MAEPLPFWRASFNRKDIIVLDTSFILDILGYNDNPARAQECEETLGNMLMHNAMAAFTCHVPEEIYGTIVRAKFKEEFHGEYKQEDIKSLCKTDPDRYRDIVGQALDETKEAIETLCKSPHVYNEQLVLTNANKSDRWMELQRKYLFPGLTDPKHLAIAIDNNATYFATTDSDFLKVTGENIRIITDSNTYDKRYNK